jgi:hypothetical protein
MLRANLLVPHATEEGRCRRREGDGTPVSSNPRAGDGPGNLNPDFAESSVVEL